MHAKHQVSIMMPNPLEKIAGSFLSVFRWPAAAKEKGMMASRKGLARDEFCSLFRSPTERRFAEVVWDHFVASACSPAGQFFPSWEDALVEDYGIVGTDLDELVAQWFKELKMELPEISADQIAVVTLKDLIEAMAAWADNSTTPIKKG